MNYFSAFCYSFHNFCLVFFSFLTIFSFWFSLISFLFFINDNFPFPVHQLRKHQKARTCQIYHLLYFINIDNTSVKESRSLVKTTVSPSQPWKMQRLCCVHWKTPKHPAHFIKHAKNVITEIAFTANKVTTSCIIYYNTSAGKLTHQTQCNYPATGT